VHNRQSVRSPVLYDGGELTYGEEKFEVPVLFLKHIDGFEVAEEALVIP
jgi:hypothetical protein